MICCSSICASTFNSYAQVPDGSWQWTWMHGGNTVGNYGIYGTPGVPDPNSTPGARASVFRWTDTSGNFWIFGGSGYANSSTGQLNDLWKYDIVTHEWTWIKGDSTPNRGGVRGTPGVPHPDNIPGSRYGSASWRDTAGNLWLFGGYGYFNNNVGSLQDLWKYDVSTNEWTFIKGDSFTNRLGVYGTKGVPEPNNRPSGRYGSACWTDADGNFWLFGGTGRFFRPPNTNAEGELNDLWRYNPFTNEWTWMHGDSVGCAMAVPGTQGVPAGTNVPPPLGLTGFWTDNNGDFWLYGGMNYCSGARSVFGDLWRYSPVTNMWTWEHGSLMANQPVSFGVQGVSAATNTPGSRDMAAATWTDLAGNLWLLGGENLSGLYNDLWKYDVTTREWTWVKGNNTPTFTTQLGVYGTRRIASALNNPGPRQFWSGAWRDRQGAIWLFGGRSQRTGTGNLNDLWRLAPECITLNQQPPIIGPDTICSGLTYEYSIGKINGATNYAWQWPSAWSGVSNDTVLFVTPDKSGGVIRVVATNHCDTSDEQFLEINVVDAEPLVITVTYDTLGTSVLYSKYQWYKDGQPIPGAINSKWVVSENGRYSVVVENDYGCRDSASYNVESILTGLIVAQKNETEVSVKLWPNPAVDKVYINCTSDVQLHLFSIDGRLLAQKRIDDGSGTLNLSGIAPGIYILTVRLSDGRLVASQRLVKE